MTRTAWFRRLSLATLASMLGACATAPAPKKERYVAPTSGPTAKLAVRGSVGSGDLFGVFVHDDALACQGARLATAGSATLVPRSTALVAGQLATLDFHVAKNDRRSCYVRMSFTPQAGRNYLVAGALEGSFCSARLLDATDPDDIKPVESAIKRNQGAQTCLTLAQSRPMHRATAGGQSQGDAVLLPSASADGLDGLLKP